MGTLAGAEKKKKKEKKILDNFAKYSLKKYLYDIWGLSYSCLLILPWSWSSIFIPQMLQSFL